MIESVENGKGRNCIAVQLIDGTSRSNKHTTLNGVHDHKPTLKCKKNEALVDDAAVGGINWNK